MISLQDLYISTSRSYMNRGEVKAFRHDAGVLAGLFGASLSDLSYRQAYDEAHSRLHVQNSRSNVGYITTVVAREQSTTNPCKKFMEDQVKIWLNDSDPTVSLSDYPYDERVVELSRRALGLFCDLHPYLRLSGRDRRHLRKKGYLDASALDRIALRIANYSASTHRARSRFDCSDDQTWRPCDSSLNRTKLSRNPIHSNQVAEYMDSARSHFMDFNLPSEDGVDAVAVYRLFPSKRYKHLSSCDQHDRPGLELIRHVSPPLQPSAPAGDGCYIDSSSIDSLPRFAHSESHFHPHAGPSQHLHFPPSDGICPPFDSPPLCPFRTPLHGDSFDNYISISNSTTSAIIDSHVSSRPYERIDSSAILVPDGSDAPCGAVNPLCHPHTTLTDVYPRSRVFLSRQNFPELEYMGDIDERISSVREPDNDELSEDH